MQKETRLKIAIGLSSVFCVVEVIGGLWSNSLAILTDASHLLTDIAGFVIALIATIVAKRAADEKYTYGLVRAEVLGALFSVMTLWIITAILLYEAYFRAMAWIEGSPSVVDGRLMSFTALFGVGVNICLATVFHEEHGGSFHSHDHGHSDDHSHGHSHGHDAPKQSSQYGSIQAGECESGHSHDSGHSHGAEHEHDHFHDHHHDDHEEHSHFGHDHGETASLVRTETHHVSAAADVNLEAAYLHVLTDLMQSIGVAIAGFIIWYQPTWEIVDPICTLMFSIFVVWSTVDLLKRVVAILFEGVPSNVDWNKVKAALEAIPGVTDIHDLHIWSISSSSVSLTCHMRAKNPQQALKMALKVLHDMHIDHVTVQVQDDADIDELCISAPYVRNGSCHA